MRNFLKRNKTNSDVPVPIDHSVDLVTSNVSPLDAPIKKQSRFNPNVVVLLIFLVVMAFGGVVFWKTFKSTTPVITSSHKKSVRIGISMASIKEQRWTKDLQYLQDNAKQLGAETTVLVADGDVDKQISQIENLISQRVDVLLIVPENASSLTTVLIAAHTAGIKIISYDRLITNSPVDMYISFDNEKVGVNIAKYVVDAIPADTTAKKLAYVGGSPSDNNSSQIKAGAMSVLDPLIKAGTVKLVYDQPTENWNPDIAYSNFKAFLQKGSTVDGVIAANDATAFGAIQALQEKGMAGNGKVIVGGQDADLPALKRIIQGTQTMTNYKPLKNLSHQAIKFAIDISLGTSPSSGSNSSIKNGYGAIPTYLLEPIPVTKDNIMQTVVADGFLTQQEVYGE